MTAAATKSPRKVDVAVLADARYGDMSDDELEAHIFSCTQQMEAAYARFQKFHVPADRDAALELLHMRDLAIKSRSPAQIARMEAARRERMLDEGVDYFAVQGTKDGRALRESRTT